LLVVFAFAATTNREIVGVGALLSLAAIGVAIAGIVKHA
jgi:hypothetical protein